eukprot:2900401-Prymnesium_polylepis.1
MVGMTYHHASGLRPMRTLLRAAARKGALPWGTTRLVDFSQDADKASASVAFIDLDEDLEGDDAIDW